MLKPEVPPFTGTESDVDNNGVVLNISMHEVSFLLTANIMAETEFELVTRRANPTTNIIKITHHGSDTSTTPEFLAVVNPQLAVISGGDGNPFGHPTSEVMDRLEQRLGTENICCNDKHGTIEFITDGERCGLKRNSR